MKYKTYYLLSLLTVVLASVYPIHMGVVTLRNYLQNGFIAAADYPKYIIPYTPISIAIIVSTALLPLIFKLFKRYTLPAVSLLGTILFFSSEFAFEQIKVIEGYIQMPLQSWQLSLCAATPEVLQTIGKPIYAENNPAFKVHFYIIAIVIILAVLNVIYGFSKMLREQDFSKKPPLIAQAVSVVVFIGLCILACFTAFYRNGTINISPLSAVLMTIFFIVFGITVGIYCGSIFYGKSKWLSTIIPAVAASLTTIIMYIGELMLMGGVLFKYGNGFFFEAIAPTPFSMADIVIIIASGVITYIILQRLNNKYRLCIRKMFVLSLIIIVSILGVVTAYSKQNRIEDLKLGSYVMQDAEPEGSSWVLLKENSQFEFNRNIAVSYLPKGTYSIKDGTLILYVRENESYVFAIDGDNLIFKRGDFIVNLVKEGAIFKFSD